jgi:AraC-like DNA-binding protein
MIYFHIFSAALAIAITFFMGTYFFVHARKSLPGLLIVFFSICLVSYVVVKMPFFPNNPVSSYIVGRFATALPSALWVLSFHLFTDSRRIPTAAWIIIISHWSLRSVGVLLVEPSSDLSTFEILVIYALPQFFMLALTMHAIYMAFCGYRDDLMEKRRRIRVYFVVSLGTLLVQILLVGITRAFFPDIYSNYLNTAVLEGIFALILFATVFGFLLMIFDLDVDFFALPVTRGPMKERVEYKKDREEKVAQYTIDNIVKLMEVEHLYREPGLSIGALAMRLSTKEYQLRRIINGNLKFRNFGQFVNYYRLNEAREKLTYSDMPIATLAMEVGYVSLSSFHKAFKDFHGMTPREFRMKCLPELATS